jgi:integrase
VKLPDGSKARISGTPSLNTKQATEDAERAHILRTLDPTTPRKEAPTFKEFIEEFKRTYVAANNKPSERISKECMIRVNLLPAFGSKRLDAITVREIEEWKATMLRSDLAPKTVNNNLTVLGRALRYAAEVGVLGMVPRVKFVKVPPAKFDFLDFEEFKRLLEAARIEPDVRAAILASGEAGLRAGEVRGLEWSDVDLVAARLTVQRAEYRGELGSPKGGRARTVPLTRRLVEAFRAARHVRRARSCSATPLARAGCAERRTRGCGASADGRASARSAGTRSVTRSARTWRCEGRHRARSRSWPGTRAWRRRSGTCT